jgi:lipopolysaccharide/colanic/teichoic acid biosynthesis glycosyltransferase
MSIFNKKEPIILLLGDLFSFILSLWLALALRTLELPSKTLFLTHLKPFSFLFLIWVIVFYIAGLYEKHTALLRSRLPSIIANTQAANSILAVIFFYFIPFFGITPKTVLFIYLAVSFVLILSWRMRGYFFLGSSKKENAVLFASGAEVDELLAEIRNNSVYNIRIVDNPEQASIVVMDFSDENVRSVMSDLYKWILQGVNFIDIHKMYEDIFDRIPLSILRYSWFLENVSTHPRVAYDSLKRAMDFILSVPVLLITGIMLPFIVLAIKLEDGGPVFIAQERLAQNNKLIKVYKFRTMARNDAASDKWGKESGNKVTRVGSFLRQTSIDELPQVWNILKGEISFIGPRSDISGLGIRLAKELPYYDIRYLIKPGISGWAQVNQHYSPGNISPQSIEETKIRLSYDLFYVKNRSFLLDLKIGLRTIKTLLSRVGK